MIMIEFQVKFLVAGIISLPKRKKKDGASTNKTQISV
jgi:hypothetical protein